jgi:glycosyltransferase involved in cell wall biosynthesis
VEGIPVERVRYAAAEQETLAYTGRMQDALGSPGGVATFYGLWRALKAAATRTASEPGTVVHAHWWIPAGLAAPASAPMVLTSHGTDVRLLDRWMPARWLARPVYQRARVVTAVSRHLAESIQRLTGRAVPLERVQPMPVDTSHWHLSTGGGGLIAVARLTGQKRLHLLVSAVARCRRAGRMLPCTIVGDGPERPALEQQARSEGVAALIEFTGQLGFGDVLQRLQRADLFVLPARQEGFGLSAAEALMVGVPVIVCTDGGGLVDLAAPGAGRVVSPDGAHIASAIEELLGSDAARDAALKRGAELRQRLAPATVAGRFEQWYQEALDA